MSNIDNPDSVWQLKPGLTFFYKGLTSINSQRLRVNNSRRIVKYVLKSDNPCALKKMSFIELPVGYLSFCVYYARFLSQLMLLLEHLSNSELQEPPALADNLYFKLFNDLLWGSCNLMQFCWWSFNVSNEAGLKGLQCEVAAQLVDLVVMIIQYQKDYLSHQQKIEMAGAGEKNLLINEWVFKRNNFIRVFMHSSIIVVAIGLLAFSVTAVTLAPIFFIVGVVSGLLKSLMELYRESVTLNLLEEQGNLTAATVHEKKFNYHLRMAAHELIGNHLLLPLSLYLLVTSTVGLSIPFIIVGFGLSLVSQKVIEQQYGVDHTARLQP